MLGRNRRLAWRDRVTRRLKAEAMRDLKKRGFLLRGGPSGDGQLLAEDGASLGPTSFGFDHRSSGVRVVSIASSETACLRRKSANRLTASDGVIHVSSAESSRDRCRFSNALPNVVVRSTWASR
jgi:hypothetical protein